MDVIARRGKADDFSAFDRRSNLIVRERTRVPREPTGINFVAPPDDRRRLSSQ
jgi:hypothetical protein